MEVLCGTAAVREGDYVRAGDLLISGVQEDANGLTRYCHAAGSLTGIYEHELTLYQPFCEELTVHGTPVCRNFLECFGKRIPLSVGFTPPPEPFVYTEEHTSLCIGGMQTPFAKITARYTPVTTAVTAYSEAEIDAIFAEQKTRFEQNFHKQDKILRCDVEKAVSDLGILLKINYVFEGVVGETSEIFVKLS